MSNEKGVWRTVGGRHIFIPDGDSLTTAMKKSGKFKKMPESQKKRLKENARTKKDIDKLSKDIDTLTNSCYGAIYSKLTNRGRDGELTDADKKRYNKGVDMAISIFDRFTNSSNEKISKEAKKFKAEAEKYKSEG